MQLARGILIWLPLDYFLPAVENRPDKIQMYQLRLEKVMGWSGRLPASDAEFALLATLLGELTPRYTPRDMIGWQRCRAVQLRDVATYRSLLREPIDFAFDFTLALESGDPELFHLACLGHDSKHHFNFRDPLDILRFPAAQTYYQEWVDGQPEEILKNWLRFTHANSLTKNKVAVFALLGRNLARNPPGTGFLLRHYQHYRMIGLWRRGERDFPSEFDTSVLRVSFYYCFYPKLGLPMALYHLQSEQAEVLLRERSDLENVEVVAPNFLDTTLNAELVERARQMLAVLTRFRDQKLLLYRTALRVLAGQPLQQQDWPKGFADSFVLRDLGTLAAAVAHPEFENWMLQETTSTLPVSTVYYDLRRLLSEAPKIDISRQVLILYAREGYRSDG